MNAFLSSKLFETMVLLLLLLLPYVEIAQGENVLVFGGNGFLGSECVHSLLQFQYNVTIVNRGTAYWDFESRIKPYVHHITCDRYGGLKNCPAFVALLASQIFDVTIDFSCYHPKILEDSVSLLQGKTKLYLFISTDSVYEVCLPKVSGALKEEDAVRPESEAERNILNSKDSYGHRKLTCEELLQEQRKEGGLPFTIFRLPDIIGPRDNTYRWWVYQLWLQFHNETGQPLTIPQKLLPITTSMVYVKDVCSAILEVVKRVKDPNSNVTDNVFNLGFKETFTLKKVLYKMQTVLGIQGVEYQYTASDDTFYLFPSVYRGPVDISKAEEYLGWLPTSWDTASKNTVKFYNHAFSHFEREKNTALQKLLAYVVAPSHQEIFRKLLQHCDEQCLTKTSKIRTIHDEFSRIKVTDADSLQNSWTEYHLHKLMWSKVSPGEHEKHLNSYISREVGKKICLFINT